VFVISSLSFIALGVVELNRLVICQQFKNLLIVLAEPINFISKKSILMMVVFYLVKGLAFFHDFNDFLLILYVVP
jgi:hypothetical protein